MNPLARTRWLTAALGLACFVLTFAPARAGTLDLLGVWWEGKAELAFVIQAGGGVSDAALDDVLTAIGDWNDAVDGIAPLLVPHVGRAHDADVIIRIKPGGGPTLGQTSLKTTSPFDCALKQTTILLSGKAFGLPFSSEGRIATARHELGHVYGLGHSDDPDDLMYSSGDPFTTDDLPISDCDVLAVATVFAAEDCSEIPEVFECE